MKRLFLFILIASFVETANAQKPEMTLSDLKLRGNVKEISDSVYYLEQLDENSATPKPIKKVIKFNNIGNKLEEVVYSIDKKIIRKSVYNYQGNRISSFDDSIGRKLSLRNIVKYDDKNQVVEVAIYAELMIKFIYEYDDNKNIHQIKIYNSEGVPNGMNVLLYNNKNDKIEEDQFNADGKLDDKIYFKYGVLDNLVRIENYNSNNQLIEEYTYSYADFDKYGNWQLQVIETKRNGIVQRKQTKRIIKYF